MNITWHGFSCIKITTKNQHGDVSILIDPFKPDGNFRPPRTAVDILVVTDVNNPKHNNVKGSGGDPFFIDTPGEYEIKGVMIRTVSNGDSRSEVIIPSITAEGINVVVVTALAKKLTEFQLEQLGQIDIFVIAVGDRERLSVELASETVQEVEPRIIIPIHFQLPGWKTKLEKLDPFLKAIGMTPKETVEKLKIREKDLPAEETELIVLNG